MKKGKKKCLYTLIGVVVAYVGFMSIPNTVMTSWLGVPSFQERIRATQAAGFWYARSLLIPKEGEKASNPQYGQLAGLTSDGRVVLKVADGDVWKRMALPLAGIKIDNLYRAAIHIKGLEGISAKIDVYREPRKEAPYSVVVWVHQKPVNLSLVEDGYARPEPKPVTSIMDLAYAHFYWRRAKGNDVNYEDDMGKAINAVTNPGGVK